MKKSNGLSETERQGADAVVEKLYRLMIRSHEFDARPRAFGTGMALSRAEIHTVQAVGHASELNMTALAASLGVTKGAASQMVSKLVAKGLIEKRASPVSAREVTLALTPLGRRGHLAHERFHREMANSFKAVFGADLMDRLAEISAALEALMKVIEVHEKRTGDR